MQPVFDIQDDPAPVEVLIPILWLMHEGRKKKPWKKKMEKKWESGRTVDVCMLDDVRCYGDNQCSLPVMFFWWGLESIVMSKWYDDVCFRWQV